MAGNNAHYLVRVYPDGSAKWAIRDEAGMQSWLEYNRENRWGNALFVDGKLASPKDKGQLTAEEIAIIEAALTDELERGLHDLSRPEPIMRQVEYFGGLKDTWMGYRPEPNRAAFDIHDRAPSPIP